MLACKHCGGAVEMVDSDTNGTDYEEYYRCVDCHESGTLSVTGHSESASGCIAL
jgi:hypothetical protein